MTDGRHPGPARVLGIITLTEHLTICCYGAMSDAATSAPTPSRSGRLLALVRALIDYGRQVVATLRDKHPTLSAGDITLILARIARGLLLAEALEARITQGAPRLDAEPRPRRAPAPSRPRPTTALPHDPVCPAAAPAPDALVTLPTAEQIAAEIRRRPIGAVIADICRDLGIMPGNKLWSELRGGSLARLVKDIVERPLQFSPALAWPPVRFPHRRGRPWRHPASARPGNEKVQPQSTQMTQISQSALFASFAVHTRRRNGWLRPATSRGRCRDGWPARWPAMTMRPRVRQSLCRPV